MRFATIIDLMSVTAVTMISAAPISAVAALDPDGPAFEAGESVRYVCSGGASFAVQFDRLHGVSTALVNYAESRKTRDRREVLLVSGPTGSGVRYSNDAAVFHTKGRDAWIDIPQTASTDAFAAQDCKQVEPVGENILTQGALAGSYHFAINRFYPGQYARTHYAGAETICFIKQDADYLALVSMPGDRKAQYYVTHPADILETGPLSVGELDASAGGRHYHTTMEGKQTLDFHFAAPGNIDGTVRGMSGLSSLSDRSSERLDCLDGGDYVYVGAFDHMTVAIDLSEDGALTYREWHEGSAEPALTLTGGYMASDEDRTDFHFFREDGSHIQLVASVEGEMPSDPFYDDGASTRRELVPGAYFVANPAAYSNKLEPLSISVSNMLGSLAKCNHLAGEYSGEPERDQQISAAQESHSCEAIDRLYDIALADAPKGSHLHAFLMKNHPVWR